MLLDDDGPQTQLDEAVDAVGDAMLDVYDKFGTEITRRAIAYMLGLYCVTDARIYDDPVSTSTMMFGLAIRYVNEGFVDALELVGEEASAENAPTSEAIM